MNYLPCKEKVFRKIKKTMYRSILFISFIYYIATFQIFAADQMVLQQGIAITGVVTDNENQPLPGVSVVIQGTSKGTITDVNGSYTLTVTDENATLEFSFIGFITRMIIVGNQKNINIMLSEATKEMEEVVVIGYGIQKKMDLTGSIGNIDRPRVLSRIDAVMPPCSRLG